MSTMTAAPRRTFWPRVANLVRRAWFLEIHGYQNAYRFVFRRPRVPAGAVGFSYHQPVMPILIVFIVVSAVETVAVDLIVHRWWPVGRIPLLVLGIWGVTFMLEMLFGMLVRQHAVGPEGIRVRSGSEIDIPLSWDDIYSVGPRKRITQEKEPRVTVNEQGEATLHLRMVNETNLEIRLEQPTPLRLPHGTETVSLVAFYADDPKAFLAEARRHLQPASEAA